MGGNARFLLNNFLKPKSNNTRGTTIEYIPIKILKENSDIGSYILHHNFNNSVTLKKYIASASKKTKIF